MATLGNKESKAFTEILMVICLNGMVNTVISLLKEVLELLKPTNMILNIEVKAFDAGVPALELVKSMGMERILEIKQDAYELGLKNTKKIDAE